MTAQEHIESLREQSAHIRRMAQYADGQAYHYEIGRALALEAQAQALEDAQEAERCGHK